MSDHSDRSHPPDFDASQELDPPTRRLFTVEEYQGMIAAGIFDEDDPIELLDGEIIKMMPIGPSHIGHVNKLNDFLVHSFRGRAIVSCQNPFVADQSSEPQPDFLVLKFRPDFYGAELAIPSDVLFIVEVSDSRLARDRARKLMIYARNGIREYWIINLADGTLEVYREPSDKGYAKRKIYRRKDHITPLAFPKKKIAVKDLLLPIGK